MNITASKKLELVNRTIMFKHYYKYIALITLCAFSPIKSMILDDRFGPFFQKPFIITPCTYGHGQVQPFFMRADCAQGDVEKESIPNLFGHYDLINIINALQKSGKINENPLRSDLQGLTSIPFRRDGRIDVQGMAFFYQWPIACNWYFGTSFLFAHVNSRVEFCLDTTSLDISPGDKSYLFKLKEQLNKSLGVLPPLYSRTVFGDTIFFLKYNYFLPYSFKFRAINFVPEVGVYIPTSPRTLLNNPASIPIGGEGRWGVYFGFENQYEVREDWFFKVMFRAIKRFKSNEQERLPIDCEPINYGAFEGFVGINPGWTLVFTPSVFLRGIRDGLGISVLYTLVSHFKDKVISCTPCNGTAFGIEPNVNDFEKRSSWGSEYISIGLFYDIAKDRTCCRYPTISAYWDIPVDWLLSERSARTHAISLVIDF